MMLIMVMNMARVLKLGCAHFTRLSRSAASIIAKTD